MGILYIVATPIGNLEDITVRAAKLLTEVGVIACEDTRHSGLLLEHLRSTYLEHPQIVNKPRLISFYDDNEEKKIPEILSILRSGQDVALITDAGTPGISDPGFTLVRACRKENIPVSALPGASASITALAMSGLPPDKFLFLGYLPKKEGNAVKTLEQIKEIQKIQKSTVIMYETPHRLIQNLTLMKQVLGDITISICRELTKIHEEVKSGTITSFLEYYQTHTPKGEFVLLWHK